MKVTAIIQARMGSTRLPGKVLKRVMDRPLLDFQLERIRMSALLDEIIIATTTKPEDDVLAEFAQNHSIQVYRGSEQDVLSRYFEAAQYYGADVIVRLTSDCPIIDAAVIDQVIQAFTKHKGTCKYASNTVARTYPRGMDTEVLSMPALKRCFDEARSLSEREHVTSYIHHHPDEFSICSVRLKQDESHHRWTVDTHEDFQLMKRMISHLYPNNPHFTFEDALEVVKQYPEWALINSHIDQKKT
ncbi:cytidylyltransferase domain-containing protein [Halobacillus sp. A5]|uniref:cytidylyltransferase domain-containing protein n=1 Tax=Halobacillus sp. A5 TaxID=2880263 RepID=UPI0020A67142|nr:glycosyltransferase family protein [Halobacillus sp. A5]MCP3028398.1 glycosyltransferase family protein [Halobacillus sp. A5]